uniref:Putative BAG domain, Ubiquitin-related domain protein n=1 Tax=Helianthus annuus TaxID=4232 RepID=A0A251U5M0_HELAN
MQPTIWVRVKFGSIYYEINISSQATFGELKKMLSGPTGLHHEDQKLMYKDKERGSKTYLDVVGVKDRLKMVLVSALESVISKGGKVAEKTLLNLIELLMNQLLKLDGITADGDVKLQRKMQVKRVQKYVETLDVLKIKNSTAGTNENGDAKQVQEPPASQRQEHIISNEHMNAVSPNQHDQL